MLTFFTIENKKKYVGVNFYFLGGKSRPDFFEKGWHFANLFVVKNKPFNMPNSLITKTAYSEQVGLNLQHGGKMEVINNLYI